MQKPCLQCGMSFDIMEDDLSFYDKASPVFNGVKCQIKPPLLCSECRSKNRMTIRNEKTLYKRGCDLCKKNIISIYSSDKKFPAYCQECFWGDKWHALDYGIDFHKNESFINQFQELINKAPRLAIINKQSENSDYCNYSFANKNCYLTFGNHYEEDCMYGRYSTKNKNCLDYLWCYKNEHCYEMLFSKNCYNSIFLDHSENCEECCFSINLKSCKNCFFCSNLRHKEFYILNKQYSKEDYLQKIKEYNSRNYRRFQDAKIFFLNDFRKKFPFKSSHQTNCENCEGDNLENCKNVKNSFDCSDSEDIKYSSQIDATSSSMDMTCMGYDKGELCYQTIGCAGTSYAIACDSCWHDSDIMYSQICFNSSYLFGCIGLKYKKYCILNKQYTKEEYEKLVPLIIENMQNTGEWGEFFPSGFSPFGYNETVANEYYPLTKEEALKKGFNWSDYESPLPKVDKIIPASKLPDDIKDIPDDILNWAIRCEVTNKPYKIIPQELKFYRDHNLPIPRRHPDQRHKDRMSLRNPRKLWSRSCDKCTKEIQTTYSPERPEKILCESCYLKEVY